jgi:4-amino-4-deoxy-L-arabinose transferase-like glycosyltransferase
MQEVVPSPQPSPKGRKGKEGFTLLLLLAVRLIGMAVIPLNETTEARYGEIARKMLETGNWVTLLHDYNIPFLAKPPLSTWLAAASMGVFGVNEFAVRLPSLLLSVGVLLLIGFTAYIRSGKEAATIAVLVLASSLGFFVAAGTVMTDPALVFCTTLILVAFWHAVNHKNRLWSSLFFVGCGLGLLAKGPVALVIAGLPIFLWVLLRKQWHPLWQRLPWIKGCLLTLAIASPWYLLAEHRTPGFLQYFIVGENIGRFLDPHWKGDRYGFAHAYPYGMIWLFVLAGLFPWCLAALGWLKQKRQQDTDGWLLYLVLWSVTSPVFFTFAANIIWPYCLMMIPGFALLSAEMWSRAGKRTGDLFAAIAALMGIAGLIAIIRVSALPAKFDDNQKDVIMAWKEMHPTNDSALLFFGNRMEFSAAFYSGGRARSTHDPDAARALLHNKTQDYVVVNDYGFASLPPEVRRKFREIGRFSNKRGTRILLRELSK